MSSHEEATYHVIRQAPKYSSTQRILIMCAIAGVHFSSAICVSLQAPFYPKEADSRNISSTYYGLVFGIFEAVSFVASPFFGNYVDYLGAKNQLIGGMLLEGICSIFFGLLDLIDDRDYFLSASFAIRIIEAIGSSAAITSAFGITAAVFPDRVGTIFARLEVAYGLGYIFGPSVGGFLYDHGGYKVPFLFMGAILIFTGLSICFLLPTMKSHFPKTRMRRIFKIPAVMIDSLSIVAISICMGFYAATLEPHIRDFTFPQVYKTLIFVISGGTYTLVAPLVGYACDKFNVSLKKMIVCGCFLTIASALTVGPAPYTLDKPTLSLVVIGLILLGFGMACIQVCAFVDAIRSATQGGFPDDITTYSLVAGLWAASFSLGAFIGPSVAGWLFEIVGFQWGSLFIVAIHILTCLIWLLYYILGKIRQKRRKSISTYLAERVEMGDENLEFQRIPITEKSRNK